MTVDRLILAGALALLVIVLFLLMARSWKRRSIRDQSIAAYPLPVNPAPEITSARVAYVATTKNKLPLERLQPKGLGFRAQGTLAVAPDGLTIKLAGSDAFFIPAGALREVSETTWAIDRAVETDGLTCVSWQMLGQSVDAAQAGDAQHAGVTADSYFRVIDAAQRVALVNAISTLLPAATSAGANSEATA